MSRFRVNIITTVIFLSILSFGSLAIGLLESNREISKRQVVAEIAASQTYSIQRQLNRSFSSTYTLAAILRQGKGEINNFDSFAAEIIKFSGGGISNLQLAPNAIVKQIHPLEGNEKAIGHNLLKDPKRRTEALAAIKSKKLTLAGPFTLIQGGVGIIARLPVFLPDTAGRERFWGFTICLIRLPDFLKGIKIMRLAKQNFNYELWRINPDTHKKQVFAQSSNKTINNPVHFRFDVAGGKWYLSIAPKSGWRSPSSMWVEIILIIILSALIAFVANSLMKSSEKLQKYKAQRQIADTLQEAVLKIPENLPGIEYGHLYSSATEATRVGGDFFDLFELNSGQIGLIVGDVSGKGLQSATLATLVKNSIKAFAYHESSPSKIMEKTNKVVIKSSAPAEFVTLLLGILDTNSGRLTYCNAGHPPSILKKASNEIIELQTSSPAIGVLTDHKYVNEMIDIESGDKLILYTDGVTEAKHNSELYGEERLLKLIKGLKTISVKDFPRLIFKDVMKFADGKLFDDLVILSIQLM